MQALKIVGIVVGSLILLAVITVGIVWFLMSRTSGIAASMTPVNSSPALAAQLDGKWEDFRDTVARAESGDTVTMAITEAELTSKIAEEMKTVELPAGMSVGDVTVNLVDGKLLLSADMKYSVFSGNAGMEATVETVNGEPVIRVNDVDFGKIPVPEALKQQLKDMIPADGVIPVSDLPFDITKLQIIDGQIVIDGVKQ